MEFFPAASAKKALLEGTLLVMPAVSIGNVGQLAVDLLVSTFVLQKVGFLEEPNVLPCAGNDPFSANPKGELTVALEVFQDSEQRITVVQQRAPVIQGQMLDFAKNFSEWVAKTRFHDVLVISGWDSGRRLASQMTGSQLRYFSSASDAFVDERCSAQGWSALEGLAEDLAGSEGAGEVGRSDDAEDEEDPELRQAGPLRGGAWGRESTSYVRSLSVWKLFESCKSRGIPVLSLILFCAEGDNIPEALTVAEHVNKLLNFQPASQEVQWKIPPSWESVYGPPLDESIFN